ncbi:hypothetical protein CR973_00900 [Candidatus Saccharibacteria bacterium]|nr:MAG: hypothetical protein CR973_00900 [Candidatus Saccharibacteria bacterium]
MATRQQRRTPRPPRSHPERVIWLGRGVSDEDQRILRSVQANLQDACSSFSPAEQLHVTLANGELPNPKNEQSFNRVVSALARILEDPIHKQEISILVGSVAFFGYQPYRKSVAAIVRSGEIDEQIAAIGGTLEQNKTQHKKKSPHMTLGHVPYEFAVDKLLEEAASIEGVEVKLQPTTYITKDSVIGAKVLDAMNIAGHETTSARTAQERRNNEIAVPIRTVRPGSIPAGLLQTMRGPENPPQ